jgi:AraC family transcriptional regulator
MKTKRHLLTELTTGKSRPAIERTPVFSSADGPWSGLILEQHRAIGGYENPGLASPNHLVAVQQTRPITIQWGDGRQARTVMVAPGQAAFIPALMPHFIRSDDIGEFVAVSVSPMLVRRIAHQVVAEPGRIEWHAALPVNDSLLTSVVMALHDEAVAGYKTGNGYAEALTNALCAQLLRNFTSNRQVVREKAPGLGRGQFRRAIDFMQANLAGDVTLAMLAREAGLSRFHFARMFKSTTGVTPHQYLLQCRLEAARSMLLGQDLTIADIAAQTGFYDQSHLVYQFKRTFGVTPSHFRRSQS